MDHHRFSNDRVLTVQRGDLIIEDYVDVAMVIAFDVTQISNVPNQGIGSTMIHSLGIIMRSCRLAAIANVSHTVYVESVFVSNGHRGFVVLFSLQRLLSIVVTMVTHVKTLETNMDVQRSTGFLLPKINAAHDILLHVLWYGSVRKNITNCEVIQVVFRVFRQYDSVVALAFGM